MAQKFPKNLYIVLHDETADEEDNYFVAHDSLDTIDDETQEVAVYKLADIHLLKVTRELT